MAIYCAKCGNRVHVTGRCRACKRLARKIVHHLDGNPTNNDLANLSLRETPKQTP